MSERRGIYCPICAVWSEKQHVACTVDSGWLYSEEFRQIEHLLMRRASPNQDTEK